MKRSGSVFNTKQPQCLHTYCHIVAKNLVWDKYQIAEFRFKILDGNTRSTVSQPGRSVATLNMNRQPSQANLKELISSRDVQFLQEVIPSTLSSLLELGRKHDYRIGESRATRIHTTGRLQLLHAFAQECVGQTTSWDRAVDGRKDSTRAACTGSGEGKSRLFGVGYSTLQRRWRFG